MDINRNIIYHSQKAREASLKSHFYEVREESNSHSDSGVGVAGAGGGKVQWKEGLLLMGRGFFLVQGNEVVLKLESSDNCTAL